jgi:DNA-binding CsgD family transcriptional regulator
MEATEENPEDQPTELNTLLFRRQPLELGTLYQTRALLSEDEFRNSETYKTTMQPIGAGHWSGIHYAISGDWRAALMVVENEMDNIAKDAARVAELLTLIGPHAVRAARIARALDMAKQAAETYSGFIDAVALPLLVLSGDARLQMANTLGQRLVDAGQLFGISAKGQLTLTARDQQVAFETAVSDCLSTASPQALQLSSDLANVALCVCPFMPPLSFSSRIDEKIFDRQSMVTVFVGAHISGTINSGLLQEAFSLSKREAEVCTELLNGATPAEISERTGRSTKTVRNQIQALHEKIGVNSTRELTDALAVFRTVGAMFE